MKQAKRDQGLARRQRRSLMGGALLLAVLIFAMIPALSAPAGAASATVTIDEALEKVADWGVMTGDEGGMRPNDGIKRAEFVAMVNRAFGYTEMGEIPFTDVTPRDWYYEDICIAYNMGYFKGSNTEGTLASPNDPLTREQAAVLIARNLCLQESVGEVTVFPDSRTFSDWSAHLIEALAEEGIVNGDEKGNFNAKNNIKRGEVAVMLVRAIGTPIQEEGEYALGGVYGNLTVTSPGVKLKDTTVVGDLYITGGLGLGDVTLENVTVLGEIIVAGAGEAEGGEHSVTLRNVAAEGLVMDSIANQLVTLKAEGLTNIETVQVRTTSYLEDLTEDGLGLKSIELDGAAGTSFYLAGNIKNVTNLTPGSTLYMAQGVAAAVTIDEAATGTTLDIAKNTVVSTLNLDAGATVLGAGDISHANVNAAGSSVSMLPDTITVRPGITADVYGEPMDTTAAAESSEDPRILSGYPEAQDVAPTSAEIAFETNKKGTLYWALTALTDGSVEEEDLIDPPSYSGKILKSGSISITASNTEFTTKLTGLTTDGSYYVSAILVDNRGMRSPVKITAFTTPDNTTPAFASGYPYTIIADGADEKEQIVQAMVMANKSCLMYYALMPNGSSTPTTAELKAGAVSGNLGYGIVELTKNTPALVSRINTAHLDEETTYVLYLWLTDADGANSSSVKKLTVTTEDRTPPVLQHMRVSEISTKSVKLTYALSEPGTLYWAVVKHGNDFYLSTDDDYYATTAGMVQVQNGVNALNNGTSKASKEFTDYTFNIGSLESQTAYDVYYVAVDDAGNYAVYDLTAIDMPYVIHTEDAEAPTVYQEFTHDGSSGNTLTPYPDTSIRIVFSEEVQGMLDLDEDSKEDETAFLELYSQYKSGAVTVEEYTNILRSYFALYSTADNKVPVAERTENGQTDWVVDYRYVTMELDDTGELVVTFPYKTEENGVIGSALNLQGGVTYYFRLGTIADTSTAKNELKNDRGYTDLPSFTTISAQILLAEDYAEPSASLGIDEFDMVFSAEPIAHEAMAESVLWDFIFWSDCVVAFDLYESEDEGKNWTRVGSSSTLINSTDGAQLGISIGKSLRGGGYQTVYDLKDRLYGIKVTAINGDDEPKNWNTTITMMVSAISGNSSGILDMAAGYVERSYTYDRLMSEFSGISDISSPLSFTVKKVFVDSNAPGLLDAYPKFSVGDTSVSVEIALDRSNTKYYYVIAPLGTIDTTVTLTGGSETLDETNFDQLPDAENNRPLVTATWPANTTIASMKTDAVNGVYAGSGAYNGIVQNINASGLTPEREYVLYLVFQGESQSSYSPVYCFGFNTGEVEVPTIQLQERSPSVRVTTSTDASLRWILLSPSNLNNTTALKALFYDKIDANSTNGFADKTAAQAHFVANFTKYFSGLGLTNNNGDKDNKITYEDVRVIDAMMANLSNDDQTSVFDYYAGEAAYEAALDVLLESTGTSYVTDSADTPLPMKLGDTQTVSPENMSSPTQYYFVATACNAMGSRYAFKAINNVHVVDNAAPEVIDLSASFKPYTKDGKEADTTETNKAISYYKGTLQITFSKTPYRIYTENNTVKLEQATGTNLASIVALVGFRIQGTPKVNGQVITIDFECDPVASITFFADGSVSDSAENTKNKKLKVSLNAPILYTENYSAAFTWSWTTA